MVSEAQKRACKRYYEKNKGNYKAVLLRFNKETDKDVIAALESAPSKTAYVRDLVRGDIDG